MTFCINCGTQLPDAANFCSHCGKPVAKPQAATPSQAPSAPSVTPASAAPGSDQSAADALFNSFSLGEPVGMKFASRKSEVAASEDYKKFLGAVRAKNARLPFWMDAKWAEGKTFDQMWAEFSGNNELHSDIQALKEAGLSTQKELKAMQLDEEIARLEQENRETLEKLKGWV